MEKQFSNVQKSFMDLSIYLSGLDLEKDLLKHSVLITLNNELKNTYSLFENDLCQSLPKCKKCDANQEKLSQLIGMINLSVENKSISEEAYSALQEFIIIIPQILLEMKALYLQSLSELS